MGCHSATNFLSACALAVLALTPVTAAAEDAQSIIRKMQEMQLERYEGVNTYVVVQSLMGNTVVMGYERVDFEASDGNTYPVFVPMRQGSDNPSTRAFLETYADASEKTGAALSDEMDRGMQQAGLPKGMLGASGGADPWVSMDPRVMMGANAEFLRQAAAADGRPVPETDLDGIEEFTRRAELRGTEKVGGRKAYHLVAEGLDSIEQPDSEEFVMETMEVWIDTKEYVPLRMKMSGTATSEGETRPFVIEKIDSDYRTVPGSSMYEAYDQTMKMGGVMTEAQQKEMQKAQAQMADMEKQLADMPPAQKQMIMDRMGPQLEMIRNMANGGGMEMKIQVHEIVVNADLPELQRLKAENFSIGGMGMSLPQSTSSTAAQTTVPVAAAAASESDLKAAQQACLEEKMAAAQAAQKKKRGFGRLMSAAARVASRYGGADVSSAMGDVYTANATAEDVAAAAKDLGLTESDIEDCKNP